MSRGENKPLVVIGAGPGGVAAALRAAQLGAEVKLIEADKVGGVCTNQGCIPLRVLGSALDLAAETERAGELGLRGDRLAPEPDQLAARVGQTSDYIRLGTEGLLKTKGVELIRGRAVLAGPDRVAVRSKNGEETIDARRIILAAGAGWSRPRIPGADLEGVVTGDELLTRPGNPGRLAILGDQPWAIELALFHLALGARVSLLSPERLLPQADRQIAGRLRKALKARGMTIIQKARPLAVSATKSGLRVEFEDKGGSASLETDKVLFTGRKPSWEGLGLRKAGVEVARGAVRVDERLRTSNPAVFALGDLTGPPLLSHKASAQGIIAAENALGKDRVFEPQTLPSVLLTSPEVAWVGLSEKQARAQGLEVVVGEMPYGVNARAAAEMNTAGFVKLICGARYKEVLGVHLIGPHSAELITQAALAVRLEATAEDLARLTAPHPSYAEALVDAARTVLDGALYLP